VDVWRRPYSFHADAPDGKSRIRNTTWHESLVDYTDGTETGAFRFERSLSALGEPLGVAFNFDVKTHWQPVESQRAQLWASQRGLAETFMDELGKRHFERATSASDRATLLECAAAVGLSSAELDAFLDSDQLREEVWRSYGDTVRDMGIHSIPLFVFSLEANGGPFREGVGATFTHGGSGSPEAFDQLFQRAWAAAADARRTRGPTRHHTHEEGGGFCGVPGT